MTLKHAFDFISTFTATPATTQKLFNGFLNGILADPEEFKTNRAEALKILDALKANPMFARIAGGLSDSARHNFACHGQSLESILMATFLGGFIAGTEFALSGGDVPDPLAPTSPDTLRPKPIVN